ncbi:hypothetical protein PGIGA_G00248470, partial [Pangasianodon gigas]|nr:hypothetical protein [Pangasianodon gigas]
FSLTTVSIVNKQTNKQKPFSEQFCRKASQNTHVELEVDGLQQQKPTLDFTVIQEQKSEATVCTGSLKLDC